MVTVPYIKIVLKICITSLRHACKISLLTGTLVLTIQKCFMYSVRTGMYRNLYLRVAREFEKRVFIQLKTGTELSGKSGCFQSAGSGSGP
jgi:hypothetical protein